MRRWMIEKDASVDGSARVFIRSFDWRFYGSGESGELSWDLWYLPMLTATESIAEIDHYLQERIRYMATGRNFEAMPYWRMVDLGYMPLVRRYHEMREALRNQERGPSVVGPAVARGSDEWLGPSGPLWIRRRSSRPYALDR